MNRVIRWALVAGLLVGMAYGEAYIGQHLGMVLVG